MSCCICNWLHQEAVLTDREEGTEAEQVAASEHEQTEVRTGSHDNFVVFIVEIRAPVVLW